MIIGVGTDVVDINALAKVIDKWRIRFTQAERDVCDGRGEPAKSLAAFAKRFAIKEAVMKALGVNDVLGGVGWHEVEVVNTSSGRPTVVLHGGALLQLADVTPFGTSACIEVSATDDPPVAQAICIIWAKRKEGTSGGDLADVPICF